MSDLPEGRASVGPRHLIGCATEPIRMAPAFNQRKVAATTTLSESQKAEIIKEDGSARNFDDLNIENSHYEDAESRDWEFFLL